MAIARGVTNLVRKYTTKDDPSDGLVANGAKLSKTSLETPRKHAKPNGQSFGRESVHRRPAPSTVYINGITMYTTASETTSQNDF